MLSYEHHLYVVSLSLMLKSGGHSAQQITTDLFHSFLADLTTTSAVGYILGAFILLMSSYIPPSASYLSYSSPFSSRIPNLMTEASHWHLKRRHVLVFSVPYCLQLIRSTQNLWVYWNREKWTLFFRQSKAWQHHNTWPLVGVSQMAFYMIIPCM